MLEKLGQRGSTAGYASRSVVIITIVYVCIVIIVVVIFVVIFVGYASRSVVIITIVFVCIVITVIVVVMISVSALMTTVLCGREASAGKLKSGGRLEPKRLCCNGSRLRWGEERTKFANC